MEKVQVGDTVLIIAGPAAGSSGIVTRIRRGQAQIVNLYQGTRCKAGIKDLEIMEPGNTSIKEQIIAPAQK